MSRTGRSMDTVVDAVGDLVKTQFQLGMDALDVMRSGTRDLTGRLSLGRLTLGRSRCEIPQPCWFPRSAGEVTCRVCPGGSAVLRLLITNCDMRPRTFHLKAAGSAAGQVKLPVASISLGPMEREYVSVSLQLPADAQEGHELEVLIWVSGCRDHYVRWTVRASRHGCDCCDEVEIEDCPDLIHHWYDHFYCARPCPSTGVVAGREG